MLTYGQLQWIGWGAWINTTSLSLAACGPVYRQPVRGFKLTQFWLWLQVSIVRPKKDWVSFFSPFTLLTTFSEFLTKLPNFLLMKRFQIFFKLYSRGKNKNVMLTFNLNYVHLLHKQLKHRTFLNNRWFQIRICQIFKMNFKRICCFKECLFLCDFIHIFIKNNNKNWCYFPFRLWAVLITWHVVCLLTKWYYFCSLLLPFFCLVVSVPFPYYEALLPVFCGLLCLLKLVLALFFSFSDSCWWCLYPLPWKSVVLVGYADRKLSCDQPYLKKNSMPLHCHIHLDRPDKQEIAYQYVYVSDGRHVFGSFVYS